MDREAGMGLFSNPRSTSFGSVYEPISADFAYLNIAMAW